MPTYVVKPGFTFGAGGRLGEGEFVELTEGEAAGFLDKLSLADEDESTVDEPQDSELWPTDIPSKTIRRLALGGYVMPSDVQSAADEKLLSMDGLGQSTLDDIRAAFVGWNEGD